MQNITTDSVEKFKQLIKNPTFKNLKVIDDDYIATATIINGKIKIESNDGLSDEYLLN